MPTKPPTNRYKSIVKPLTTGEKAAIFGCVASGYTPTQACDKLVIPMISYSHSYHRDKAFKRDIEDCLGNHAQLCWDKMEELGLNGNVKALEESLSNISRLLPKDDPRKWRPSSWAPPESADESGQTEKDYLIDVFKFAKTALGYEVPKEGDKENADKKRSSEESH